MLPTVGGQVAEQPLGRFVALCLAFVITASVAQYVEYRPFELFGEGELADLGDPAPDVDGCARDVVGERGQVNSSEGVFHL